MIMSVLLLVLLLTASPSRQNEEQQHSDDTSAEQAILQSDISKNSVQNASITVESEEMFNKATQNVASAAYSSEATRELNGWPLLKERDAFETPIVSGTAEVKIEATYDSSSDVRNLNYFRTTFKATTTFSEVNVLNLTDAVNSRLQTDSPNDESNVTAPSALDITILSISRTDDSNSTASTDGSASAYVSAVAVKATSSMLLTNDWKNEQNGIRDNVNTLNEMQSSPSVKDYQRTTMIFSNSISTSQSALFDTDLHTSDVADDVKFKRRSTVSVNNNARSLGTRLTVSKTTTDPSDTTKMTQMDKNVSKARESTTITAATSIHEVVRHSTKNQPDENPETATNTARSSSEQVTNVEDQLATGDATFSSFVTAISETPTRSAGNNTTMESDRYENNTRAMILVVACACAAFAAVLILALACVLHYRLRQRRQKQKIRRAHETPRVSLLWPLAHHRGSQLVTTAHDGVHETNQKPTEMVENELYSATSFNQQPDSENR